MNYQTFKVFDISTIHITEEDDKLLRENPFSKQHPVFYRLEFGYLIFVDDRDVNNRVAILTQVGFSESFGRILEMAISLNCKCVMIDRDGPEYKSLAKYDW